MGVVTSDGSTKFFIFVDEDPVGRETNDFLRDVAALGNTHHVRVQNVSGDVVYRAGPGGGISTGAGASGVRNSFG
jgi:hypothetical protein